MLNYFPKWLLFCTSTSKGLCASSSKQDYQVWFLCMCIAILIGLLWCVTEFLMHISLITEDAGHLSIIMCHLFILCDKVSFPIICPVFNWVVLLSGCWVLRDLDIVCIQRICQKCHLQVCSHNLWLFCLNSIFHRTWIFNLIMYT